VGCGVPTAAIDYYWVSLNGSAPRRLTELTGRTLVFAVNPVTGEIAFNRAGDVRPHEVHILTNVLQAPPR